MARFDNIRKRREQQMVEHFQLQLSIYKKHNRNKYSRAQSFLGYRAFSIVRPLILVSLLALILLYLQMIDNI